MPTLSSPVRPPTRRDLGTAEPRISLRRTSAPDRGDTAPDPAPPVLPWLLAALGGSFGAAVVGWVVVVGITVLGWLTGGIGALSSAIRLGTQLWLLANGAGAQIGGARWTLIPLGVTAVFAVVIAQVAGFAARQARAARLTGGDPGAFDAGAGRQVVRWVALLVTLVYVAVVSAVALAVGAPGQALRGFVVSAVLAAAAGTFGAARALDVDLTAGWPGWLRPVPRAVAASVCVVALGGCAAVVVALVQHGDGVASITTQLDVTAAGGVVLALIQLSFWPNVITWAASWTLGAGFTLGDGSLVSPTETDLGLLPAVPILGALPPEGVGGWPVLSWLAVAVLAGVVGASIVVRSRPAGRFDETSLVGGLAGVVSGVVVVLLAALSRGDLGSGRLVGLGPRLLELGVMAVTLMGLSGMLAGLVWGLVRRPRRPAAGGPAGDADDDSLEYAETATSDADPDDEATTSPADDEVTTRSPTTRRPPTCAARPTTSRPPSADAADADPADDPDAQATEQIHPRP